MKEYESAERLAKLINIKTISSVGLRDDKTFDLFLLTCKELFPELFKNAELHCYEKGFYLIYKGKKHDNPILFMNHHDVVSAGENWNTDPFKAVIKEGKIYGRGVLDTKGGLYCMLEAANNLVKENFIPENDIFLLSDNDEETFGTGGDYISSYFQKEGINFAYVLDEGGLITNNPLGFTPGDFAMIAVGEKAITEIKFIAASKGGHSSNPPKNSPLIRLSKFMLAVENSYNFHTKINKTTLEMFKVMSKSISGPLAIVMKHPVLFYPLLKVALAHSSDLSRAMLKTTVAFTWCRAGDSYNVIPTEAAVIANIRIAHHQGVDNTFKVLNKYCKKYGIVMEKLSTPFNNVISNINTDGYLKICEALKEVYPDVIASPYVANSASDARYFSRVSKAVYGLVPFKVDSFQIKGIHGDNEFLNINALPKAIRFYEILMRRG